MSILAVVTRLRYFCLRTDWIYVLQQAQKDALESGLVSMQDIEMMAAGMMN